MTSGWTGNLNADCIKSMLTESDPNPHEMYFLEPFRLLLVTWSASVVCQGFRCINPKPLLEGRRQFDGAVLRASNSRTDYPVTEARINDDGWCSGQQGENIFDPYLEVNFGQDVIFDSIVTQGFSITNILEATLLKPVFTERYRIEVAGENKQFQHIAAPTMANSTNLNPAVFPLVGRIDSTSRHQETLPRPVVGQWLRISPYEWNNEDNACTKLEIHGCPLLECHTESQLTTTPGVSSIMLGSSQIPHGDLFNFDNSGEFYCAPTDQGTPTITIEFPTPVLLTEVGIHGNDRFLASNQYVTRFSLSYENDDGNFTEYIRQTGLMTFNVPDHNPHFFGLWPPINTSSIEISINNWSNEPCLSLLLLGCSADNVTDHSVILDNSTANTGLVDNVAVTLTTTELVTTTESLTTIQTSTIVVTVTADVSPSSLPVIPSPLSLQSSSQSIINPSPKQSSSAATSCSSNDKDNTPIYIAVVIVVVALLLTAILVIVGVILYRYHKASSARSKTPIIAEYKSTSADDASMKIVEVNNDLYGAEPRSGAVTPSEETKEKVYQEPTKQSGEKETAVNPLYGDTIKSNNDDVYSYAIP